MYFHSSGVLKRSVGRWKRQRSIYTDVHNSYNIQIYSFNPLVWDLHLLVKIILMKRHLFVCGATAPQWASASTFLGLLDHTQRRTTVGRTPLYEWSARRRDLYLTTQNTHNRQTSMPPVRFEPTISADEGPQTYALALVATGIDMKKLWEILIK